MPVTVALSPRECARIIYDLSSLIQREPGSRANELRQQIIKQLELPARPAMKGAAPS